MKLFNNYLNGVKTAVGRPKGLAGSLHTKNPVDDLIYLSNREVYDTFQKANVSESYGETGIAQRKVLFDFDQKELAVYFGHNPWSFPQVSIGPHPDFSHLTSLDVEKHYCVSLFVDIKGSTRLALDHDLEVVRLIKDTMLTMCIHVATFFGGHVHRLQGDAAFIQFVRKGMHPNDAVINALNTATLLCQFVSNDLEELFVQEGLKPIKVRIGIDYGSNDDVLWSRYGIPGCDELTTTSLYTDLAAKLQGKALNNSVRIGQNIVDLLDLPSEFLAEPTIPRNGARIPDPFILKTTNFKYRQHEFNWIKYLNGFAFMRKDSNGRLYIEQSSFQIKAELCDSNQQIVGDYYQNSKSIEKGWGIKFKLYRVNSEYFVKQNEEILWEAINRGRDAHKAGQENHDFNRQFANKSECLAGAEFLGHHILKCTIKRQFQDNIVIRFPVFVR